MCEGAAEPHATNYEEVTRGPRHACCRPALSACSRVQKTTTGQQQENVALSVCSSAAGAVPGVNGGSFEVEGFLL